MKAGLRMLTPLGWLALAIGGILVVAVLAGGLGFRWDPLGLDRRRLDTAQAQAAAGRAAETARRLEQQGEATQQRRLDIFNDTTTQAARATATAVTQARSADDAHTPLDPDRLRRLREHDRELCRLAPDVDGCAAPGPA
ncbi:hypothetical protein [Brevundimonas sp. PAMC22021]|uniref:hypothetical protein n=1 Tax=Brevundimonas sp. PAMC22021 TaxID=2861285 RepID=UPI001C639DBA|nr:hypothetical protein [Brevundimonas sp. PAMC22021]QYF87521.1 hypothetical protein KY493_03160 [Brevundimonas sp. PAMC22021]